MQLPEFLHEQDGEIRLVGHRISLFQLLAFYQEGYSAEMLREQFPTLSMALIHKVLGFYWENRAQVDSDLSLTRNRLESARASGDHLDLRALRERHQLRSCDLAWAPCPDPRPERALPRDLPDPARVLPP
jgi:uncharacterized protein (DUF433 family)